MFYLIVFIIIFLSIYSVEFRLAILNPFESLMYVIRDTYEYFRYKLYNKLECGKITCYEAPFGGGKTLSGTHHMRYLYNRYHNKKYYDKKKGKWITQKVLIISNVVINDVSFEELKGLKQFVEIGMHSKSIDEKNDTRTCAIGFIDEASVQLNSRNFKNNIDAAFLGTLLTCRHFNMSLYVTSQKFSLVDALLRSVTQTVIHCEKKWRFMVQYAYNADDIEYATNPMLVKPLYTTGFFIKNKDYDAYDTLATVENLERATNKGDMLTEEEILTLRGNFYKDNDQIVKPSRKLKRLRKTK